MQDLDNLKNFHVTSTNVLLEDRKLSEDILLTQEKILSRDNSNKNKEDEISNHEGIFEDKKGYIFCVDDNPFNLLVAENVVEKVGYHCIKSQSGQECINMLNNLSDNDAIPKLILMDCQMPVMDGFETAQILNEMMKNGQIPKIPIVALTANNREEDKLKCFESGMVGHLSKPLFSGNLVKALSTLDSN